MWKPLLATLVAVVVLFAATAVLSAVGHADEPPVAPGPEERVLFVPDVGIRPSPRITCWVKPVPGLCRPESGDGQYDERTESLWPLAGLTTQNAGSRDVRLLAVYTGDEPREGEGDPCEGCNMVRMACSPPVAPGDTWVAEPFVYLTSTESTTATIGTLAEVFSLNTRLAREYGAGWEAWLAEHGLDPDTSLADLVCDVFDARLREDPPDNYDPFYTVQVPMSATDTTGCDLYRSFREGYLTGGAFAPVAGLPFAPFRGEPIAGVARVMRELRAQSGAQDRYRALSLAETGAPVSPTGQVTYTYYVPGVHLATPDGLNGIITLQNTGLGCANVRLAAFRTGMVEVGGPLSLVLLPGQRISTDLGAQWTVTATAAVRITSTRPLAAALWTRGYHTSATYTALRERRRPAGWAVPLAYQEERGTVGAQSETTAGAEGWESNVAVLNPTTELGKLVMNTQAAGRRPREVSIPIGPERHAVLQLGFGLGSAGGPGWARLSTGELPMYAALESLRQASDVPAFVEHWATTAWPRGPDAPVGRTIALPDLSGVVPSVASDGTVVVTDALRTQVAVQNLVSYTAEVAIDTYADCGFAGTDNRTIDPFQTIVLTSDELPQNSAGTGAALLRVLEGEVAALAEFSRPAPSVYEGSPADFTTAYLGSAIHGSLAAPTATLAVSPTDVVIPWFSLKSPPIDVFNAAPARRCMDFRVTTDAPWLAADPGIGPVPGQFRLLIDRRQLEMGTEHVATVTVTVDDPGVAANPQHVRATVRGTGAVGVVFLPVAAQREELGAERLVD